MSHIAVDPDAFVAASATFGDSITTGLSRTYMGLLDGLHGSSAMGGSDSTGQQWAHSYDEAAREAAAGTQDVINGCYKLAALLEATGFNHGYANAASTPGAVLPVADTYGYEGQSISLPGPVSAHGGSGSGPPGWGLIASHLGGYLWPNGHQDKLHTAAAYWAQAARAVTEITYQISPAVALVRSQVSPEVDSAVTVCAAMSHHLGDLSAAYNDLSTACTEYAHHLDHAHQQIIDELVSFLEWTAAIEATGLVVGLFTFGAGEVAAQAAEGSRLAVTATRIVTFLEDLTAATKLINEFIARIPIRILELTGALKPLLTARIIRIGTDVAANTANPETAIRTAEQIATNNLDKAATDAVTNDLSAAEIDLAVDEEAGGHTLAMHVGRTDQQLLDRNIQYASTFNDREAADVAIAANISKNTTEINEWLQGSEAKLEIRSPMNPGGGQVYEKATGTFSSPSQVLTVLKRTPGGYFILTSFPEP